MQLQLKTSKRSSRQLYKKEDILETGYNADETGLNWKALPNKTLAAITAMSKPGYKVSKEKFPVLVTANASGSHALPLFVIGKAQKPRCFNNIFNLPLIYKRQKMLR